MVVPRHWPVALVGLFTIAFVGSAPSADVPIEQVVGGIEAIVFVCAPIETKSAKTGTDLLNKTSTERKLDLPALRKTDGYKAIYNSEVNRLLALPTRDRSAACRNAW